MTRFKYPHNRIIDYLSLALSLYFIVMVYKFGMSMIRELSTKQTTPIYACGLSEACQINGGEFTSVDTPDYYTFTCRLKKIKDTSSESQK